MLKHSKKKFCSSRFFFLKNGVHNPQSATTRPSQKSTALHAFRPKVPLLLESTFSGGFFFWKGKITFPDHNLNPGPCSGTR